MKDFLAIFPAVYLVDNVVFWVLFGLFFRWYDTSSALWSFLVQIGIALALGLLARLVQKRRVVLFGFWRWRSIVSEDSETLRHVLLTFLLLFPCLVGYDDVLELTGSPYMRDRFFIGRVRSVMLIDLLLVFVFALIDKWSSILGQAPFPKRDRPATTMDPLSMLCLKPNHMKPRWLLYLGAIETLAIFIDLAWTQTAGLNLRLFGMLLAYLLAIFLFNVTWFRRARLSQNNKES